MKRIAQHFIMSKMADHITSGSCYYTTSGNDATAITGDDTKKTINISSATDQILWFISIIYMIIVTKKSSLMSLQRIKNKGADQLANFSTLIVCFLDSIIPMVSLFNVNHVLYSAGWFESLISPKHPRRFSCYTAVIVVEILYTWMNFNSF